LAKQHPSFTLVATLTEPEKEASSWRGETRRIDHSMIQRYVDDLTSPVYYIAGLPDMVSAMKTVLTASGVSKDNIRAEEFTGFILGQDGPRGQHDMTHSNNRRIRPLLLVAMVVLIIIVVNLHAMSAISLFTTGFGAFSLNNPILYILMGLFLVIVLFKFKHVSGFLYRKKKQPTREMSHGMSSMSSTSGVQHEQRQEELDLRKLLLTLLEPAPLGALR